LLLFPPLIQDVLSGDRLSFFSPHGGPLPFFCVRPLGLDPFSPNWCQRNFFFPSPIRFALLHQSVFSRLYRRLNFLVVSLSFVPFPRCKMPPFPSEGNSVLELVNIIPPCFLRLTFCHYSLPSTSVTKVVPFLVTPLFCLFLPTSTCDKSSLYSRSPLPWRRRRAYLFLSHPLGRGLIIPLITILLPGRIPLKAKRAGVFLLCRATFPPAERFRTLPG